VIQLPFLGLKKDLKISLGLTQANVYYAK
jgi:hypothetical protein